VGCGEEEEGEGGLYEFDQPLTGWLVGNATYEIIFDDCSKLLGLSF
jgi:hypothetical protein